MSEKLPETTISPNVCDIVRESLTVRGYSGLSNKVKACSCDISSLAPCGDIHGDCRAFFMVREGGLELGYTPSNLRALQQQHGLSNSELSEISGATITTVCNWRTGLDKDHHHGMPHQRWVQLLGKLEGEK